MPKTNDLQIIERLTKDSALEMKHHDLEELLDSELRKPAEEIDAQLVEELLDVLQPEDVPAGLQQKVWKNISKQITPRPRQIRRLLYRLVAAAAIAVVVFGLTLGAAQAFRWTFLLKLLQPVAETFGIYMNYSDDQATGAEMENQYGMSEDENTTVLYHDLSQIPDTYDGHAIKPGWVPEGYEFAKGSVYTEVHMQKYTIHYLRGQDELSIFISIYPTSDAIVSYAYERTAVEIAEKKIASKMVTFYRNAQDQIQSVSWVDGNVHYSILGNITIEDIEKMVGSFLITPTE